MAGFGKVLILSAVVGAVAFFAFNCGSCIFGTPAIPNLNEDQWWGAGAPQKLGDSVTTFKIDISDKMIQDLHQRLDAYLKDPATPPLENQGFQYGFNSNYLKEVISHWRNKYNWTERQAYLNQFPQYNTVVNGLEIHFIMVKPNPKPAKKVVPLLLLHGWPGSVREFYDLIPLLTTPREESDFVFQVVAPSLPGYGFSSAAQKPGLGPAEMAVVMKNLMQRLGFDKFYVQGGDWGALIASNLGVFYPDRVLGVHSNMCAVNSFSSFMKWFLGSIMPSAMVSEKHQSKMYPMKKFFHNLLLESGYFHLQATKPDTVGVALHDSPAGLAAYILEKFSTWTNPAWRELPDGGLTKKFTLDALLDNVMMYWLSGSILTSQRLYAESFSETNRAMNRIPVRVPMACARFPHDLLWQTKCQLSERYKNILQLSDFDDGGHFAAFEVPRLLANDVWSAVDKFEAFHAKKEKPE